MVAVPVESDGVRAIALTTHSVNGEFVISSQFKKEYQALYVLTDEDNGQLLRIVPRPYVPQEFLSP